MVVGATEPPSHTAAWRAARPFRLGEAASRSSSARTGLTLLGRGGLSGQ
jgi:hypothetical protein